MFSVASSRSNNVRRESNAPSLDFLQWQFLASSLLLDRAVLARSELKKNMDVPIQYDAADLEFADHRLQAIAKTNKELFNAIQSEGKDQSAPLRTNDLVEALLRILAGKQPVTTQQAAISELSELEDSARISAIDFDKAHVAAKLLNVAGSPNSQLAIHAWNALCSFPGDLSTVKLATETLQSDAVEAFTKIAALNALRSCDLGMAAKCVPVLTDLVTGSDSQVQTEVLATLKWLGAEGRTATPVLVELICSSETPESLRREATIALAACTPNGDAIPTKAFGEHRQSLLQALHDIGTTGDELRRALAGRLRRSDQQPLDGYVRMTIKDITEYVRPNAQGQDPTRTTRNWIYQNKLRVIWVEDVQGQYDVHQVDLETLRTQYHKESTSDSNADPE